MKKITFKSTPARLAAIIFTFVSNQALAQNLEQNFDNKAATNLENSANSTTSSTSENLANNQPQNLSKTDFESKEAKPTETTQKETTQKEVNLEEAEYDYIYVPGPGNSSFYLKKPRKKLAKNQISESQNQTDISKNDLPKNDLPKNPDEQKTALSKTSGASKIKTQGHYFGVSGVLNKLIYHEEYNIYIFKNDEIAGDSPIKSLKPSSSGNGVGMGVSYKYALNFNDFFIAPGFFYEKLNTSVDASKKAHQPIFQGFKKLDIKDRYGFVADIGYDFNQFISPYFIAGYSWAKYSARNGIPDGGQKYLATKNSAEGSYVYGLGVKTAYNQNISFNFELQTQSLNIKTNTDVSVNDFGYQANYKGRLNTLKLGAFYNF
jgi:opacity protein-like surface antigen